jgi:hypothetical protein
MGGSTWPFPTDFNKSSRMMEDKLVQIFDTIKIGPYQLRKPVGIIERIDKNVHNQLRKPVGIIERIDKNVHILIPLLINNEIIKNTVIYNIINNIKSICCADVNMLAKYNAALINN